MNGFAWKGHNCTEYGIRVTQQPEIIRPPERATFTSVPGRSGTLTTLEGEDVYDDFLLTVECFIQDLSMLNTIFSWLKGSSVVTFANRQGGFYYARIVNQISLEQILRGNPYRRFPVTFRCQPFFYLTGVSDITVTTSGVYVTNPGAVISEPKLAVTLSGDAQIIVSAAYFELIGLTGVVTVDTVLKEIYQGSTSCNSHMAGEFPVLLPGQNIISWTGGVTKIVITPNWRQL